MLHFQKHERIDAQEPVRQIEQSDILTVAVQLHFTFTRNSFSVHRQAISSTIILNFASNFLTTFTFTLNLHLTTLQIVASNTTALSSKMVELGKADAQSNCLLFSIPGGECSSDS